MEKALMIFGVFLIVIGIVKLIAALIIRRMENGRKKDSSSR